MKSCLLSIILSLISFVVAAQMDTCISNLKNAGADYDQGNYDEAIHILNNTLKGCTLSKQDQLQVNKLLILCYLGIDNLEAANNTAAAIMKIDPNYKPDKFKDDPKYSALFVKFKPEPTLAIGISGGFNSPGIHVEHTYSVLHPDDAPGLGTYKSEISYQLGAGIEKRAYKNLWLALDFQFRNTGYKHTLDNIQGSTVSYSENLNYMDFPLSLKYYFLKSDLRPYLQAGADFSFLTRALSTTTRDNEKDIVDRTALRNNFFGGYFGEAGVSYSIKAFRLFGSVRYTYFPQMVNKEGTRYADNVNLYVYYYVDDDFRMDNIQFNAGLSYILSYKITKVK